MADPLKDTSLEAAQREIHRRLLREEKLMRIEEEEMRRLAAMGWKPPIERTAANGPSVHDAAETIEETERRRRAFAREARRRAEARQAQSQGQQPNINVEEILGEPVFPHRGPPTAEERERMHLQSAWKQFNAIEKVFREGGQTRAADMWRHYLDRGGDAVVFSPSEIREYNVVKEAEKAIERYFLDWMTRPLFEEKLDTTFRVPQKRLVKTNLERIGPDLLAMKDGETMFARSNWDRRLRYPYSEMEQNVALGEMGSNEDLYGFLGEAQLGGSGGFQFTRRGDTIEFDGTVVHGFNEPFNFEAGRDFPDPSSTLPGVSNVVGADGELLQKKGLAKEFDMRSQWTRRVQGRLKIDPTGKLVLDGSPVWTDVDPSERWP